MRRDDICLYLTPADRAELQGLITDRNTLRKLVWRAGIVLATAEGRVSPENAFDRATEVSHPVARCRPAQQRDKGHDAQLVQSCRASPPRGSGMPPKAARTISMMAMGSEG